MEVAVREKPILFNGEMIRRILDGSKTQTRRVMRIDAATQEVVQVWHEDGGGNWIGWTGDQPDLAEFTKRAYPNGEGVCCPYGQPGDRLWVRETFYCDDYRYPDAPHEELLEAIEYRASHVCGDWEAGCPCTYRCWTPSIHMPRWASRITLEVTEVRVERLQDISELDARDEGIERVPQLGILRSSGWRDYSGETPGFLNPVESYRTLWDSINGTSHPWESNPWVFVISFKRGVTDGSSKAAG